MSEIKKTPINKYWVVSQDGEIISDPFLTLQEANQEKDKLNIESPELNCSVSIEKIGFVDENNTNQYFHTCVKCGAQFHTPDDGIDNYCGVCEWEQEVDKIQEEVNNKKTVESSIDDEPNERTKELLEITKNPHVLLDILPSEPATIADLKISEANNKIVYEFLVKPILDKADEIIQLLNGLDIPKDKAKIKSNTKTAKRLFNIADDLVAHKYKQPKKEEKIVFTNRANTEYKVVKEDLLNLGYQENYKDVFKKGLDPIVSRDKPVFGFGKVLQPLNKTISAMKKSIDEATSTANDRYNKHLEAQAKAKQEAEAKAQTEAQGGKESANN